MSNELHNTLRSFGETWLGIPGWAWLAILLLLALAAFVYYVRQEG